MGRNSLQPYNHRQENGALSMNVLGFQLGFKDVDSCPQGGLFASIGQAGMNFSSPNPDDSNDNSGNGLNFINPNLLVKFVSSTVGVEEEEGLLKKNKKGLQFKIKVKNPSLRRLLSGAVAGAVSRTAVAPLETIRTHLMVGSGGNSTTEVFHDIMQNDGWKGLFRGNLVNVIRVAPSKAIEV